MIPDAFTSIALGAVQVLDQKLYDELNAELANGGTSERIDKLTVFLKTWFTVKEQVANAPSTTEDAG